MKERYLFIVLAAAAVLVGCQKESLRDRNFKVVQPTVFTATVEDIVETRTTFNPTDLSISWETGDHVNINGSSFISQNAGASTTLDGYFTIEVRPQFVSSPSGGFDGQEPSMLVDSNGTETKWCAHNNHKDGDAWTIIVSTDDPSKLQAVKLWNGGDTQQYPERSWKDVTISGSASASGPWEEIKSFRDLDLAANNGGFAGTLNVDATALYQYYKIDISAIMGGDAMQMSDMKFLILDEKGTMSSSYTAYFPEKLYNDNKPTLPSSVSETWEDGRFNMPMYAYSTSKNLQFKNLCGILKVVVKNDQLASVKSIIVSSLNCATSGAFTVKDNKAVLTSPSATANNLTINYTEAVPTTSEGTVFYIPVPSQTYRDLQISIRANDGLLKIMTVKSGEDFVVERNRIYTIDFAGSDCALKGEFSVSPTRKVHFSQGSLWADVSGDNPVFNFEANQYDVQSSWSTSHVSHFFWSKDASVAYAAFYRDDSATDSDVFFTNDPTDDGKAKSDFTVNGVTGKYRTLSSGEWQYLFNTRIVNNGTGAGKSYSLDITYGGRMGFVLYPDDYTGSELSGTVESLPEGVVFIPAAGYRSGSAVNNFGDLGFGYYWSSTAYRSLFACRVCFGSVDLTPSMIDRNCGYIVRLVIESE